GACGETGRGGGARLLAALDHEGNPEIHGWVAARDGSAQFVSACVGAASGVGGRPFVAEVWRHGRRGDLERTWSTAPIYPDGLSVLGFAVKPPDITIRYEARDPGWKPGCEGQTELIDRYRVDARGGLARRDRRAVERWR